MSQNWLQLKELGNNQFKNKNYSSAIEYYTRGINMNPSEPVLYANRGTCFKCLGKYKESVKDYKKEKKEKKRKIEKMNIIKKKNLKIMKKNQLKMNWIY